MTLPQQLLQRYSEVEALVDEVASRAKPTLQAYCEQKGYAFIARKKTLRSVQEKIETGRFGSWSDIDDLFACSIIVPTLSHEEEVIKYCEKIFDLTRKRRNETKKSPTEFRFDATRLSARLRLPPGVESELSALRFEVQIRSAFDHAWMVATHPLVYKGQYADWEHHRIASQMKAMVEQLDMLLLAFEGCANVIKKSPHPSTEECSRIAEWTVDMFANGSIPSEMKPESIVRFSDNLRRLLREGSRAPSVEEALTILRIEIENLSEQEMPRSVTLLQFLGGILLAGGYLAGPWRSKNYFFPITREFRDIFPGVGHLVKMFEY